MPRASTYLRRLLGPFFRWWWATISGVASFLAWFAVPEKGIEIGRGLFVCLILLTSALLFLTVSVLWEGWLIYSERVGLRVRALEPSKESPGAEWMFVLESDRLLAPAANTMIALHRRVGSVEALFALAWIVGSTTEGLYQARPLWMAPVHLRDFKAGKFAATSLLASTHVDAHRAREAFHVEV